jgi:hypothetical protein
MSEYDDKSRGRSRYKRKIVEKSKIKYGSKNSGVIYHMSNSLIIGNLLDGKSRNVVDYPTDNEIPGFRTGTCSPPPKRKRNRTGFNRGKPGWCSYCCPKITIRCNRTSLLRRDVREVNKIRTSSEFEDTEFSNGIQYIKDGYETS